jgi:HlyD family secretion protein
MDIARPSIARQKRIKRIIYGVVALIAIAGVTVALSKLKPAAPTVDGSILWPDTVKRGPMTVQVHGLGTLVPEDIRWIPAQSNARVERIVMRSGMTVKPDSIIVELTDPQLENDAAAADLAYKQALADYKAQEVTLNNQLIVYQTQEATTRGQLDVDTQTRDVDVQKFKADVGPKFATDIDEAKVRQDTATLQLEEKEIAAFGDNIKASLASQQAKVDTAKTLDQLKKEELEALHVRAGMNGVIQCVCTATGTTYTELQEGQQVTLGTNLARVADPSKLKATVQIPETQANTVALNQTAEVDTRNGIVQGHVTRIDGAVVNGTRGVDISFDQPLPKGAVSDLSVDGTITIESLKNILYVGRPVHGEPNTTVGLFKYTDDGKQAVRVQVQLGRASVNTIEILGGLKEGDRVILSDMSQWDAVERIEIK